jgi:pilin isopeptide linkage protein
VGDLEHVAYDKTDRQFTVTVDDKDMDGKLEIGNVTGSENTTVVKEDDGYGVAVTFTNGFTAPDVPKPAHVNITVNKTVVNTGTTVIGPENFEFVLEELDTGKKTARETDENGVAIFDLTFTEKDINRTYTYTLHETDDGKAGILYSDRVYTIAITVRLNEKTNQLTTTTMLDGMVVDTPVTVFENIHDPLEDVPPSPPSGENDYVRLSFILFLVSGSVLIFFGIQKRGKTFARH